VVEDTLKCGEITPSGLSACRTCMWKIP